MPPLKGSQQVKRQIVSQLPYKFPPSNYDEGDRPFITTLDFELTE